MFLQLLFKCTVPISRCVVKAFIKCESNGRCRLLKERWNASNLDILSVKCNQNRIELPTFKSLVLQMGLLSIRNRSQGMMLWE
ncbi:hypothetical protein ACH3XW_26760 [Acanthocheilonema viteae]